MSYEAWLERVCGDFDYPGAHKVEFSEDGTAYAHCGGAYPLIFPNAVRPYEQV